MYYISDHGSVHPVDGAEEPIQPEVSVNVSCLMVTENRERMARRAIACFRRQSYPRRELVIVDTGSSAELAEHVDSLSDRAIAYHHLPDEDATLGELRNESIRLARGEVLCQWDDDDLFDPDRVHRQLAAMLRFDVNACFLLRWMIWWPQERRIAASSRRIWEGSMMARRVCTGTYPALARGEDGPVVEHIEAQGPIVLMDAPELYTYVVHGANTWGPRHFDPFWSEATEQFVGRRYTEQIRRIRKRVPLMQMPA